MPIPKRPKAFSCRLKKTIEKPFEFKIELEVDMKEWVDPVAVDNALDGDGNSPLENSPLGDQLDQRKNQRQSLKLGSVLSPESRATLARSITLTTPSSLAPPWKGMAGGVHAADIQLLSVGSAPEDTADTALLK